MRGRGATRSRPATLDLLAYALIATALIFSLYSALHANWLDEASSGGGGGPGRKLVTNSGSGDAIIADTPRAAIDLEQLATKVPPCPEAKPVIKIMSSAAYVHNPRKYHLVTTCQGFSNQWQARIHYYW